MKPPRVRVIAICLFRRGDEILVFEDTDSVKDSPFYRPLGGEVEPGEFAADAVVREIREELGQDATDIMYLGTLENLFEYEGEPGHEIVFVFDGRFADPGVYDQPHLAGKEENGLPFRAVWRKLDSFDDHHRLVPEGLAALIATPSCQH